MIDPSILLDSKPVQIETPLDAQTQAQNLQNMGNVNRLQKGELAMQPVQLQAGQMENEQRRQDLQDQQNMRRAYVDAGGDLEQTKANAMKYGVSPKTLMALDASVVDRKTKLAALDKETLANRQEKNNQLSGIISPVLSETDPKTQEAKWNSALQIAQQNQLMTAQEAAQHPYPGADGVKLYAAGLTTEDQINKKITAEAAQRRADATAIDAANNTARTNATLPGLQADSERKQLQNIAGNLAGAKSAADYAAVLGDVPQKYAQHFPAAATWDAKATPASVLRIGMTPDQQVTTDQSAKREVREAAQGQANLNLRNTEVGFQGARLNLEGQRLNWEKTGGPTLDNPVYMQGIVNGEIQINPRDKNFAAVSAAAKNLDPTWSSERYSNRQHFTQSETSGPVSKKLESFNQVTSHLGELQAASAALGSNVMQYTPGPVANLSPSVKRYNDAVTTAGAELATTLAQGQATQHEVETAIGNLKSGNPQARAVGVQQYTKLIGGRLRAIAKAHVAATGDAFPVDQFVDSDAVKNLQANGVDPYQIASDESKTWMRGKGAAAVPAAQAPAAPAPSGSVSVTDPNGGTHVFRSQAQAAAFKKVAGIR